MLSERRYLSAAFAISLFVTGCTGGWSVPSGGSGGATRDLRTDSVQTYLIAPLSKATAPTPLPINISQADWSAQVHAQPNTISHANVIRQIHSAEFYEHMLGARHAELARRPQSVFQGSTSQQVGYHVNAGYDDMSANLTAYSNIGSISLTAPDMGCLNGSQPSCDNSIVTNFHPGTNAGTGNCLEAGTGFYRTNTTGYTASIFWVGDFCNTQGFLYEGFPVQETIDAYFQQQYIVNLGDGLPRITVELLQPSSDPNTNDWYALIYNYYYQRWDQVYMGSGNFLNSQLAHVSSTPYTGWSLDEYHFESSVQQLCPQVPTASADGIQVNDESTGSDSNNYFRPMNSNDFTLYNAAGGCFVNNSALGYQYNFGTYYDQWNYPAWAVTDPGPKPTPRPSPTPLPKCGKVICQVTPALRTRPLIP